MLIGILKSIKIHYHIVNSRWLKKSPIEKLEFLRFSKNGASNLYVHHEIDDPFNHFFKTPFNAFFRLLAPTFLLDVLLVLLLLSYFSSCHSPVGKSGVNRISLQYPGCQNKGTIMHEIGHSLGKRFIKHRNLTESYITL